MLTKVYSVHAVSIGATMGTGDNVPALTIVATGMVNSSGWSLPQLVPRIYVTPPADGLLDLDFLAMPPPPDVMVNWGFMPITARTVLAVPDWVKGVRVHAATNSMEARLSAGLPSAGTAAPTAGSTTSGGGQAPPWPFPWFKPGVAPPNI